jgi:hypothetical protein
LPAAATATAASAAAAALDGAPASAAPEHSGLAVDMEIPPNLDELRNQIFGQFHQADFHVHLRRIIADTHALLAGLVVPAEAVDSTARPTLTSLIYLNDVGAVQKRP